MSYKRLLIRTNLWLGLLVAAAGIAAADPIGGPGNVNCSNNSCQGALYTLSYSGTPLPDADPLHQTFRITYTIDTSTYTGTGVAIDAAAIKVSSSVTGASLFSAPSGVASWNLVAGGINAGGCSGSGGGFECADWIAGGVGAPVGGILTWVFDVTMNNNALFTDIAEASIKARYVNASGSKVGALVSENITLQRTTQTSPTPEPTSLLFLGTMVTGMSVILRRKLVS